MAQATSSHCYVASLSKTGKITTVVLVVFGPIVNGDKVAFCCYDNTHYLAARNGGGCEFWAVPPWADVDEMFTMTISAPVRVIIEVDKIICRDTEDETGADEFYLYSTILREREKDMITTKITDPINVNASKTATYNFPVSQRILFSQIVDRSSTLILNFMAYDEDCAKSKDFKEKVATEVIANVGKAVGIFVPVAGTIINIMSSVIGIFINVNIKMTKKLKIRMNNFEHERRLRIAVLTSLEKIQLIA